MRDYTAADHAGLSHEEIAELFRMPSSNSMAPDDATNQGATRSNYDGLKAFIDEQMTGSIGLRNNAEHE